MKKIIAAALFGVIGGLCAMQHDRAIACAAPATVLPQEVCSICLEHVGRRRVLCKKFFQHGSASHYFHERCLLRWLRQGDSQTCPVCRAPIKEHHPEHKVPFEVDVYFQHGVIELRGMLSHFALRTRGARKQLLAQAFAIAYSM